MKRMIVGTTFGRIVMSARDATQLLRMAFLQPEGLGTLVNDQLATLLVTSLCHQNKVFVDVGAHIGSIIAEVMRHDRSIRIIAIEAIPEKIANLRRKFPSVELHGCAVGDSEGETSFYVKSKQSGCSSLGRPSESEKSNTTEITVPIRRLDSLIQSTDIDVMKLDVEGAELGVLRGSEQLVAKNRPLIMFESAPPNNDGLGYTKEAMWDWFAERDFGVIIPTRVAHEDPGLSREGFIESHLYPRRTTNYFAIPKERRIETRDLTRRILNMS